MSQEFHLLAGKLEQQCKDVEAGEDSNGGEKGGGGGSWRKLLEKTRREMLEAAGLALQVALKLDQMAITMKLLKCHPLKLGLELHYIVSRSSRC